MQTTTSSVPPQHRPLPRVAQIKTFAQAIFTGKYVAPEVVVQRLEICRRCEKRRITPTGVEWCGICGCKVGNKSRQLDNLAAYEENLPKWGCKHPLRGQGKGWPVGMRSVECGMRNVKAEVGPLNTPKDAKPAPEHSGGLGNGVDGGKGAKNGQKAPFFASGASRNGFGSSQNDSGISQNGSGTSQNGFGNSQSEFGISQKGLGTSQIGSGFSQNGSGSSRNGSGSSQDGFGISQKGSGSSRKEFGGMQWPSGNTAGRIAETTR